MRSRKYAKAAALVLVLACVSVFGALSIAHAACTTTVTFQQSAINVSTIAPDSSGNVVLTCLHDINNNKVSGASVTFTVTRPGDTSATAAGSGITDANGNASSPLWTDTAKYGSYALKATVGSVSSNGSVTVAAGTPKGAFTMTKQEATPAAGAALHINLSGIVDAGSKPVSNGTSMTLTLLGPAGFTKTYPASTTGVSSSADTSSATLTVPGGDLTRAGNYTVKAYYVGAGTVSQPDASAPDLLFSLASGAIKSVSAAVNPTGVVAGNSYDVKALNALDSYGNKATGQPVTFEITDALNNVTDISTVGGNPILTDSNGNATAQASAAAANVAYGFYSMVVKSGTATSPSVGYQVNPGPANAITNVAPKQNPDLSFPAYPSGSPVTITVNGIKFNTFAAKNGTVVRLDCVSVPSGTSEKPCLGAPASQQVLVSGVTKGDDVASASFDLPGDFTGPAGHYTFKVTADGATALSEWDIVAGLPVADLTASALDAQQYTDATVNVGNLPTTATKIVLRITRPNGTTFSISAPVSGDPTAIVVPKAQLPSLGTYGVQAYAEDATNTVVGVGSTSFKVASAIPDKIDVTPTSTTVLPLQGNTITAKATMADPDNAGQRLATPGRLLSYTVKNLLGQTVASGNRTTDSNGEITFALFGSQLLLPGTYDITVTDAGGATGTAQFLNI